jgi:hypothetical protein
MINKKGRKSKEDIQHLVTDKNKILVLTTGQFCSKQELMRQLGIGDQSTFDRHFGADYDASAEFWKSKVAQSLYKNLQALNPQCTIFGAKTLLGLKEVSKTEISGADGKEFKVVIMDRVIEDDE